MKKHLRIHALLKTKMSIQLAYVVINRQLYEPASLGKSGSLYTLSNNFDDLILAINRYNEFIVLKLF